MSAPGLKRLQVWARANGYALKIYREVLPLLPGEEKWALCQQLRRSSVSVSANIAEGHGRFYYQDNVRFCYNARGSLDETLSHLIFACEAGYIPKTLYAQLVQEGEEIEKMLNSYIGYLKRSRLGADEPGAQMAIREDRAACAAATEPDFEDNGPTDV
jgi:four helix bundle protein